MKVREFIELLNTKDPESELYILTKSGRELVGRVMDGKYFNTVDVATKVSLTVDEAETSLYQLATYDHLTKDNEEDIARSIGQHRVDVIKGEIEEYKRKMQEVRVNVSENLSFEETEEEV